MSGDDAAIVRKLDVLIRLLSVRVLGDRKGGDAILTLDQAGLDTEMICQLTGASSGTVRSTVSRARRRAREGSAE